MKYWTSYTREDIKRIRKQNSTNKAPQSHTKKDNSSHWFRCDDKSYLMIYFTTSENEARIN